MVQWIILSGVHLDADISLKPAPPLPADDNFYKGKTIRKRRFLRRRRNTYSKSSSSHSNSFSIQSFQKAEGSSFK